ncbi:hypothetical protein ACERK3_09285 [Phycisphaerales bacterium AB-hyl4]|uniref:Uncharacterized protein n=1 Tax=Natronomicrosphaera hydrolytica TaxID=3242702 RepID=A0ABV4U4F7_9BACT
MSLSEYRTFLRDMMTLQLRYACCVMQRENISLTEALCDHTELYSYCDFYNPSLAPMADECFVRLAHELDQLRQESDEATFAAHAWRQMVPHLEPRIEKDLAAAQTVIAQSFHGFTYELVPEYFGADKPLYLTLHFRNDFGPDSPFNHRPTLIRGLMNLLQEVQANHPTIDQVQCATWMNHLHAFTSLFPAEWTARSNDCPYEPNAGWWGQFIDRRGQVHPRRAAILLSRGTFPYTNRHCRCSLNAWREHLANLAVSSPVSKVNDVE